MKQITLLVHWLPGWTVREGSVGGQLIAGALNKITEIPKYVQVPNRGDRVKNRRALGQQHAL